MGNIQSIPENHKRIYKNLLAIQSIETRLQMIGTLLESPECVKTMKQAGIYGHILHYKTAVRQGDTTIRLPGEGTAATLVSHVREIPNTGETRIITHSGNTIVRAGGFTEVDQRGNERALSYFSQCLRVLDLEEEVALTEEVLKTAYKKAGRKAHPDKGGSEAAFEAVTRAYAYLADIMKRIHGGRVKAGVVQPPELMAATRGKEADQWKHIEPVKLNPKKLDINAFNNMFEKTHVPDPDSEGYGDWLKGADGGAVSKEKKFSGKFNRDVFNSMFDADTRAGAQPGRQLAIQAQPLTMAPMFGDLLGKERSDDYTAPANASTKYTDLKIAYTRENTFSQQVSDVKVQNRSMKQLEAERGRAPDPLTSEEMIDVQRGEQEMLQRENSRQQRVKEKMKADQEYFERMKRLVIQN